MSEATGAARGSRVADVDLHAEDRLAREQAIDPRRSIILQAPAGSGKTTVLTQRFLRLLAEVDEPEEILAVTFTRKAAAEMRTRVLRALAGGIDPDADPDGRFARCAAEARARSAQRGWDLEATPARLRIMTIDALNRSLAARLPLTARATIGLQLADPPHALYRQAARRALLDAEDDAALGADLDRLLERLDNDRLRAERLFAAMLAVRAHWLPLILSEPAHDLPARVVRALASIGAERLARIAATMPRTLIEEGVRIARTVARQRAVSATQARGPATLADWRAIAAFALTERGDWRRALTRTDGFPPEEAALKEQAFAWIDAAARVRGAREALSELQALPDPGLEAEDAEALRALANLLRLAASELEMAFGEARRIDHAYVAAAARRVLTEEGAPTDLSLRLGERLRHILVDEFQDTSSEQVELLRALTAGWQAGDGRSLFLVGDPMQSIYLFRHAEVGLYLRIAQRGLGSLALDALALTRNFRASRELTDWLNGSLARIFPETEDVRSGAVAYSPCTAGRTDHRGRGVVLHRLDARDPAAEARTTLTLVREARAAQPGCSIAVLVPARAHAVPIAQALRAAQIPVAGIGLVPIAEVPAVRDLGVLARALDHPGDRTAWLAVLRAPWCGLTLRELTGLLEPDASQNVWDAMNDPQRIARLPGEAQRRLARTRAALAPAIEERGRETLARLVEAAWLRLGGPATCRNESELAHAERFFERLAVWSQEPDWTGAEEVAARLATSFADEPGGADDAVQIMTIHRAKGLEFDVVIVPALGRALRNDPEPLLRWLELPGADESMDLLIAPVSRRGADLEPLNAYLKGLQARRAAHERARLLYVAATRARRELHLTCDLPPAAGAAPVQPRAGTLLATLWPAIAAQLPAAAEADTTEVDVTADPVQPSYRLPVDWRPPAVAGGPDAGPRELATALVPEFVWVQPASRWAGRVVHEQLRDFARRGITPDRAAILAAREGLDRRLAQAGLAPSEQQRARERAIEALLTLVEDEKGRWLFAPDHRETASPLELTGVVDGALVGCHVDRSFVDAQGVRWLVDLKMGTHHDADVDAFVASEIARYRPQLERALALAARLGPEPVRAALYFPLLRVFRTLPAPPGPAA